MRFPRAFAFVIPVATLAVPCLIATADPTLAEATAPSMVGVPGTLPTAPAGDLKQVLATPPQQTADTDTREAVEADISTRKVAVTSVYNGTQIVVFGAIDNRRPGSSKAWLYDIVVVVEGARQPLVARKKSRVGGIWMNTGRMSFEAPPTYYAIGSNRPLEEIADEAVFTEHKIGLDRALAPQRDADVAAYQAPEAPTYRDAIIRLKMQEGLYRRSDYNVVFIGRTLFRAAIDLPANVPVGGLVSRVYLFRDGKMLSSVTTHGRLEREGIAQIIHDFALRHALLYGVLVVITAVLAGLAASAAFRRSAH